MLLRITRKLPSELPTHIVEQLGAPVTFLLLLIGLSTCNNMVHFPGSIDEWLSKGFYACFILAFLWGIFRIIAVVDIHVLQKRLNEDHKLNKLLSDLIRRSVKAAVWTMAVIFIAQNLFNLNVTALITGAGVAGLAITFAAQNTIANLFGAMSLISDRTFKVGDRIICNGSDGMVEAVGFRSTRLRSLDGTIWNIPNRILSDSTVENITERNSIKYAFTLGLVYSTTPEPDAPGRCGFWAASSITIPASIRRQSRRSISSRTTRRFHSTSASRSGSRRSTSCSSRNGNRKSTSQSSNSSMLPGWNSPSRPAPIILSHKTTPHKQVKEQW